MSVECIEVSTADSTKVMALLEDWVGYYDFKKAMSYFQDLDVYLVGGAVRNVVLNISVSPKDFDFVLLGKHVEGFISYLKKFGYIENGQFLSPRWFPYDKPVYCDLMDIDKWNTGLKKCEDITDVLGEFDFTGNALAMDLKSRKLYDPVGGCEDLKNNLIRGIRFDFPDLPIRKDTNLTKMAIHWFRYIMYSEKLGLEIETNTLAWIKDNTHYLKQLQIYCVEFNESPTEIMEAVKKHLQYS